MQFFFKSKGVNLRHLVTICAITCHNTLLMSVQTVKHSLDGARSHMHDGLHSRKLELVNERYLYPVHIVAVIVLSMFSVWVYLFGHFTHSRPHCKGSLHHERSLSTDVCLPHSLLVLSMIILSMMLYYPYMSS